VVPCKVYFVSFGSLGNLRNHCVDEMINHAEIPSRYEGWVCFERPNCIQYWHDELKQSLFFDETNLMSTGTLDKMYRILLLGTWEDFEDCCERCGVKLSKLP
jgi:hypothetical protein